jgi:PTH1 family peptidyl-tRNA hydrolase
MQNIIEQFGTDKFKRIRIGIGEPPHNDSINYVLGKPKGENQEVLDEATSLAAKALRDIGFGKDFTRIMNQYNTAAKKG